MKKRPEIKVGARLPDQYVKEMYEYYQTGKTLREVGIEFGEVSPTSVSFLFKRRGYSIRPPRIISESVVREMYEYYQTGKTLWEVEIKFGFCRGTAGNLFKLHNFQKRSTTITEKRKASDLKRVKPLIKISEKRLRRLYLTEGKPIPELVKMLGFPENRIYKILKHYGIPIRDRRTAIRLKHIKNKNLTDEVLRDLKIKENLSAAEIAVLTGYNKVTIFERLKSIGLGRKKSAER